jgi:tryptophan synthase beta chain
MRLLGAEVRPVAEGTRTLKDAVNAAVRDWVTNVRTTHYLVGSVVGMHPFPVLVRDLQRVIGVEARRQCIDLTGRPPDAAIACVGGGSNSIGLFHPLLDDATELIGVEAAGHGITTGKHAATLSAGSDGVLHGSLSMLLQNSDGQIMGTHSISAGLDYPGVGPEHAWLLAAGRARYESITDAEALDAVMLLARHEGIVPALESAHAVAQAMKEAARRSSDETIVVNISGRGDKDLATILARLTERGDL